MVAGGSEVPGSPTSRFLAAKELASVLVRPYAGFGLRERHQSNDGQEDELGARNPQALKALKALNDLKA